MALIRNHKVTVITGIVLNVLFMLVKFAAFLLSHLNLFFADAIDSLVDCFVIFLIVIFLRFNLNKATLTFLNMDMMLFAQWSVILVYRIIIVLDQVQDLITPEPRRDPLLIIIVSAVIIAFGILLAILFVDEDDVVKFFIPQEEKDLRKLYDPKKKKPLQRTADTCWAKLQFEILPVFAETLDNLVTAVISLVVGILLYFEVISNYLYIIDDVSNILISIIMFGLALNGMWRLSAKYSEKSHFRPFYAELGEGHIQRRDEGRSETDPLLDQ